MNEFEIVMKTLSDGLRSLSQGIEVVAEKVDSLAASVKEGDLSEQKPADETSEKSEGKPRKPATSKKSGSKGAAPKKEKEPMSDTVFRAIIASKNGIDLDTLKKKTGLEKRSIHNAVYKLKKQGKIKSERKGFYEAVNDNLKKYSS